MQKIRSIIGVVSSKYRLIFSNFMHFGFNVGYAYECCVFCFRAKFQEVITRICLAQPLLRWRGTEGLVGHLQPWNDLCVSGGLVQQQLPLPVAPPGARTAPWVDACPSPSSGACTHFCCWLVMAGRCDLAAQRVHEALLAVCCEVQLPRPYVRTASDAINQVSRNSLIWYWGKSSQGNSAYTRRVGQENLAIAPTLCGHRASLGRFSCFAVSNVSFIFIHNHFACQVQNGWEVYSSPPLWQDLTSQNH